MRSNNTSTNSANFIKIYIVKDSASYAELGRILIENRQIIDKKYKILFEKIEHYNAPTIMNNFSVRELPFAIIANKGKITGLIPIVNFILGKSQTLSEPLNFDDYLTRGHTKRDKNGKIIVDNDNDGEGFNESTNTNEISRRMEELNNKRKNTQNLPIDKRHHANDVDDEPRFMGEIPDYTEEEIAQEYFYENMRNDRSTF